MSDTGCLINREVATPGRETRHYALVPLWLKLLVPIVVVFGPGRWLKNDGLDRWSGGSTAKRNVITYAFAIAATALFFVVSRL